MLLMLRNALRGSVLIEVCGPAPERFLNLCAARGTAFWDVQLAGEERLTACVTVPGYFLLCRAARRGPCRVRAIKKPRFTLHCAEADASEGAARLCRPVRRVRMVSVGFHLDDRNFRL